MSNVQNSYPKRVWILVEASAVLENNQEVIDHEHDRMIGGTFDALVAEKLAAILKENQSSLTMIRSDINPLSNTIIDVINDDGKENDSDQKIDDLLSMVDIQKNE